MNKTASTITKSIGIAVSLTFLAGCGGADGGQRPCARTEDACRIPDPPPINFWWDVAITDYSDNPDRPAVSLTGDQTIILNVGDTYVEEGATADDLQDGDLTAQITITTDVDTANVGDYFVRYGVVDSDGLTAIEVIRIVRVIGTEAENHSRRPLGSSIANFGFLEHLPPDYGQSTGSKPPLLIYLHGGGGNLEFTNTEDPLLALDAVIANFGIPKLIEDRDWDETLPFVVLSPQLGAVPSAGYRERFDAFFEFAIRTYDIDTDRIYFTGYSQGGFLSAAYAKDNPNKIAAVASAAPAFPAFIDPTMDDFCGIAQVPFWIFHATNDAVIPYQHSLRVYDDILGSCNPPVPPKMSLILGAEHAIHHAVFNLEAMVGGFAQAVYDEDYEPYDVSVYEWLLTYSLADR
ncbi:MAG: alpha/beta fold hydrolase [Pseudomonadota bacterium]